MSGNAHVSTGSGDPQNVGIYRGSEMGLPEWVVDELHMAAAGAIRPEVCARACCCLDDAAGVYTGSEMGLSDARIEELHAQAAAALDERRAEFARGNRERCVDCPNSSKRWAVVSEPNDRA